MISRSELSDQPNFARFGAVRGLETFYQLYNVTDGTFPSVNIKDYPSFAYRGFLIDTSRHFLPVESIFKVRRS